MSPRRSLAWYESGMSLAEMALLLSSPRVREGTLPVPVGKQSQPTADLTEFADPPVPVLTPREFLDRLEP